MINYFMIADQYFDQPGDLLRGDGDRANQIE
jgi:hypothetical protein